MQWAQIGSGDDHSDSGTDNDHFTQCVCITSYKQSQAQWPQKAFAVSDL